LGVHRELDDFRQRLVIEVLRAHGVGHGQVQLLELLEVLLLKADDDPVRSVGVGATQSGQVLAASQQRRLGGLLRL
jgi:hypothetical protein